MIFTPSSDPDGTIWVPEVTAEDSPELIGRPSTKERRQMFQ
jgi:hypothetical protein